VARNWRPAQTPILDFLSLVGTIERRRITPENSEAHIIYYYEFVLIDIIYMDNYGHG
jgi:hypothetical protein